MAPSGKARVQPSTVLVLRAPDEREVRVHVFPSDPRLGRDVAQAWARLAPDRTDQSTFRKDLQSLLRRWYPLLAINPQEGLGAVREDETVWYVFRDGGVAQRTPWRDDLHAALGQAREAASAARETMDRSMQRLAEAQRPRRRAATRAMATGGDGHGSAGETGRR